MCPAKFWMQDSEKFVPQGCKRKKNDKNRIRKKNSKKKMRHNNFKILFLQNLILGIFRNSQALSGFFTENSQNLKILSILRILIVEHFFEAIGNLVSIIFFRKIFIKSIKING